MTIDVEIKHFYYHHLITVAPDEKGEILLEPLQENQQNAVIRFFLQEDAERSFLKEYTINLRQSPGGKPRIKVSASIVRRNLTLTIVMDNKILLTDSISLRSHLKSNLRVPLIAAGVLLLLLIIFFGIRFIYSGLNLFSENSAVFQKKTAQETEIISKPHTGEEQPRASNSSTQAAMQGPASLPVVTKGKISKEETIYFYPNSTRIRQEEQNKLSGIISLLIARPDLKVTLSGHCALWGTKAGRLELSKKRVQVIKHYLEEKGWKPEITPRIRWYGAQKPATTDPEKKDLNRRVEIQITSSTP